MHCAICLESVMEFRPMGPGSPAFFLNNDPHCTGCFHRVRELAEKRAAEVSAASGSSS